MFVMFSNGVCDPEWSATANYDTTCAPAVPSANCMWWIYKRPVAVRSGAAAASGGGVALAAVATALAAARRL